MADVLIHYCPNCGGPLTFNPSDQKFHCDYCLSIFTVEDIEKFEAKQKAAEQTAETSSPTETESDAAAAPTGSTQTTTATTESDTAPSAATDQATSDEVDLFLCPSCGAQIATDKTTAATYCYFCHNPVVLSGRLSGKFLPNKVLPFKIDRKTAEKSFLEWTGKKKFVPKDFFNQDQIEKITGVYFPYWVVDAETNGEYSGQGTALRVWIVGDLEYTETKIYQVYRKGTAKVHALVKNALTKNVQQKMVESVQPFPVDQAVDFHTEYLSGFQAEKRDIEIADLAPEIESELKTYTTDLLKDTVSGYTTFTGKQSSVSVVREDNHYMLLPVWLVTYHDTGGKTYYYAMNGQTGKTSGVLPISNRRLGTFAFGIFAAVALLGMIVGYLI